MFSMKMFRTAENVLKHQLNDVYAHRKKEVYNNIRTGNDWIYNCNIYKEWCYEKLLDLERLWADLGVNFKKVNVISGGYAFYDGPYWLKLGVKEIWLYETDAEIRKINWRLTDYIKNDITIKGRTLDPCLDYPWIIKEDIDLYINFNCEKHFPMKQSVKPEMYPPRCIFAFLGSGLKYDGPDTPGNGNINITETLDDFIETLPDIKIIFKDTMDKKHMVIGCFE